MTPSSWGRLSHFNHHPLLISYYLSTAVLLIRAWNLHVSHFPVKRYRSVLDHISLPATDHGSVSSFLYMIWCFLLISEPDEATKKLPEHQRAAAITSCFKVGRPWKGSRLLKHVSVIEKEAVNTKTKVFTWALWVMSEWFSLHFYFPSVMYTQRRLITQSG